MGKRVNTKRRNTKHRNTNRKLKLLRGGAGTSAETSIKISQNKAYIIILLNIIKDLMITLVSKLYYPKKNTYIKVILKQQSMKISKV